MPDGTQQVLAWIRNFEPEFAATYVLRRPVDLLPGSVLHVRSAGACSVHAIWAQ